MICMTWCVTSSVCARDVAIVAMRCAAHLLGRLLGCEMTTRDIELRAEHRRKEIVMRRIAQPGERFGTAAVTILLCLGLASAVVIGYALARAM